MRRDDWSRIFDMRVELAQREYDAAQAALAAANRRVRIIDRVALVVGILVALAVIFCASVAHGGVAATRVSPDGQWRIEVADYRQHQVFELWATPSIGGVRRQIGRPVPALSDVRTDLLISPDSRRVVYVQGETASGSNFRLWSTSIDRLDGRVISQQPAQPGVGFESPLGTACQGRYIEFRSDPVIDETFATYTVSFAGELQPCAIFTDGFEGGTTAAWR